MALTSMQRVAKMSQYKFSCRDDLFIHQSRTDLARQITAAETVDAANQLVEAFLNHPHVRLSAVLCVLGENRREAEVARLFESTDPWKSGYKSVRWYRKLDSNGDTRPVCSALPNDLRAVHYMIKWCLEAQLRPQASLFGVPGKGSNDMVRNIHQSILDGYPHLGKMTIQNCYQSISPESLRALPLPEEVIRNALDTRNLTFKEIARPCLTYDDTTSNPNGSEPTGLLRGSPASNIMLAWLLPEMPTSEKARVFICGDKIAVAARTERPRRIMMENLEQLFASCPSGPLTLHETAYASPRRRSLDFLGYTLRPNGREIEISPSTLTRLHAKLSWLLTDYYLTDYDVFVQAARLLRGYANNFSAAPNAERALDDNVLMMSAELERRGNYILGQVLCHVLRSRDDEYDWLINQVLKAARTRRRN